MIRVRGTVEYVDGRSEDFRAGSIAFQAWERFAARQGWQPYDGSHPNELAAHVAYTALRVAEGFDAWVATVFDVDVQRPDGSPLEAGDNGAVELVPPTPPAASPAA